MSAKKKKAAKGPPRRISQETFDEAVQQNIDDFDLDPDEAVADAVKEFELQNVDLSEIDKSYAGPEGRGEHPVVASTKKFVEAVEAASRDPGSDEKRTHAYAAGNMLRSRSFPGTSPDGARRRLARAPCKPRTRTCRTSRSTR